MRIRAALAAVIIVVLMIPEAAFATLANEQRQGQALVAQIRAGIKTCADLSSEDFDHIGEYAVFRALGSTSLHQAMNERMTRMLGPSGESRMHQLLGRRYAGCPRSGYGMMGGSGMMGGYAPRGWANMMGAGGWGWMMGGTWRNMTRQDWQQIEQRMFGTHLSSGGGWSALATIAVILGAGLILAIAILATLRHRLRWPPGSATQT